MHWEAPMSWSTIRNWVCDSTKRQRLLLPNQNIQGFYILQGWVAKGSLKLHMLLLCLAFMPYWIPLKDKQISQSLGTSLTTPVSLSLWVTGSYLGASFGRIKRKIERNISGAPVLCKEVMGLLLPKMNSVCYLKKVDDGYCCKPVALINVVHHVHGVSNIFLIVFFNWKKASTLWVFSYSHPRNMHTDWNTKVHSSAISCH